MKTVLIPALAVAAAAFAVVPLLRPAPAQVVVANAGQRVEARTPNRAMLEPRGGETPVRLRELSLRGQNVGFGEGTLEAAPEDRAGPTGPFTLKHTDVDARVSGFVERVQVTQEFSNPFHERVEAVYIFPLPDNAAVDDMTLLVGDRAIQGIIKKRDEARRDYEEAKAQGRRAALLDQERPNIFTQSVANILPGESVKVVIRYVAPLRYDDGTFEFNFPMVVGPRYVPGQALPGQSQGTGTSPDTDRVIDASRVTPATLPPGERSGRDIAIRVRIDAGFPIEELSSVSHRLFVDRPSMRTADVELASNDRVPNKDLIVRWKIAGSELRSTVMATRGQGGGYFALMVQPEAQDAGRRVVPKEMVFVIDTSGSMTGFPLEAEKRFMRKALTAMGPDDTFMLIDFASHASSFHPTPLPNTPRNVERALSYLEALPAGGGTNQLDGIIAALDRPLDPNHLRTVLFMTDGFIGNEVEILDATQKKLGNARLFSLGVGTSVNHYLLSRLADVGRGFYQYVRPDEDQSAALERLWRRIAKPLMTDIEIDWGGLPVSEVLPRRIPDLFDHQPLIVLGKYAQGGNARVTVRGHTIDRDRSTSVDVSLPEHEEENEALATLWARARIEELEKQQYQGEQADIVRQITSLGLEHRLVTAYTSFVAVDKTPAASPNSPLITAAEPIDLPDKVTMGEGSGERTKALQTRRYNTIQIIRGGDEDVDGKDGNKSGNLKITSDPSGSVVVDGRPAHHAVNLEAREPDEKPPVRPADPKVASVETKEPKEPVAAKAPEEKPPPRGGHLHDDFDEIFGGGGGGDRTPPPEKKASKPKDVYIPPAPGAGGGKATLEQGDVMEVVVGAKGMIKSCTDETMARDPGAGGTIVMRWTIRPDGNVTNIQTVTADFQHTPLSACLAAGIKQFKFPAYAGAQMAPINFPFIFGGSAGPASDTDAHALVASGQKAISRGDYRAAFRAFKRALELDPNNQDARNGMTLVRRRAEETYQQAYVLMGRDPDAARLMYRQILEMTLPTDDLADKARKRLNSLK